MTKDEFKDKYGYELGVPVNWSAYEDIAEFFTGRHVKEIDGVKVYGHMDYGKKDPSISAGASPMPGCRWPASATRASRTACRLMNGASALTKTRRPVGSCVCRGGDTNGPAASLCRLPSISNGWRSTPRRKPAGMDFLSKPARSCTGQCAQQIFWYTAFIPPHGRARSYRDERRRHAEVAHGPFAARPLLAGRHEARLSGCRILDALQVHPD